MSRIVGIALVFVTFPVARAQQLPPVRPLGPIERVSTEPMRAATTAVALSDGRVYVNDVANRRILLFDSTLSHAQAVADSTSVTAKAYGARPGTLFAFRGDSALFVDPASGSMLVLGPDGRIDRVIAMPTRPGAPVAPFVFDVLAGVPGFDRRSRLVSTMPVAVRQLPASPEPGKSYTQQSADSMLIVA